MDPEPEARTRTSTRTTAELVRLDRAHLWHPFTQMQAWMTADEVLVIERGEGNHLVDTDGRRYLDGISALWCNLHGHRVEAIDYAIRSQLDLVAHSTMLGLTSVPAIELAARLVAIAPPDLSRVFYSDSGATAVEAALKIAFQFHLQSGSPARTRFAALSLAYHGDTVGSVSLGGIDPMHGMFDPLRFEVVRLPAPYCYRCPLALEPASCGMRCALEAEAILRREAGSIAALVIEPLVQGAAGMIVQPPGFLSRIASCCHELGVLLVADEVATGFGRTGTLFACTQEGVCPDIMCVAKGLTGGYLPVAATLATDRIFEAFLGAPDSGRAFLHGHTYTGNPLGCAAALASLDLLEPAMRRVPALALRLASRLHDLVAPLDHVGEVRRCGLMTGIEIVADRSTRAGFPPSRRTGHRAALHARSLGVILRPLGDVLVLMPMLSYSDSEIDLLVDVAASSIRAVT